MNMGRSTAGMGLVALAAGVALGCTRVDSPEVVGNTVGALVVQQTVSISVPAGTDFRTTAVAANGTLQVSDRAVVGGGTGSISNAGTTLSDFGVTSRVGKITSVAKVVLHDRSTVTGSVTSGSTVQKFNDVTVTGGITQNAAFNGADITAWRISFTQSTQDVPLGVGQSVALAPGTFANVTVERSATLSLRSGSYYFNSLALEPQGTITLDSSAGPIFIYVQSNLAYRGRVTGGTPDKLLLAYLGSQPLSVLESPFRGTLVAPNAPVRLGNGGGVHKGAVFAKNLQLDPDVQLGFVPFAGWSSLSFEATPRFECVESRANGSKIARFGYLNPNVTAVTVPGGSLNQFVPAPADRRQPTTFLPGSESNSFAVSFAGTPPRWSLNGIDATVDTSKTCSSSIQLTAIQDTTLKAANPLAAFGTNPQLTVGPDQFALANFDRKALLAARGTARFIKSAHLQFTVNSGSAAVTARPIRHEWTETSATWTCANDQNPSATAEQCLQSNRWVMPFHAGRWTNPYYKISPAVGTKTAAVLDFDVTEDVQRFIGPDYAIGPMGWVIQPSASDTMVLGSREGGSAARLILETVTLADDDLPPGTVPFGISVDSTLATSETLPVLADGVARPLSVLKTSEGRTLRYAENELVVMTNDAGQLSAIKARWNATELSSPNLPSQPLPGLPSPHLLRVDATNANTATLVPNLRRVVNRPDGLQKVSSDSALRLLAAFASEYARGTSVAVNWQIPGAEVTAGGFANKVFVDGTPAAGQSQVETSSNSFEWAPFGPGMHDVNRAWGLLFFSKKLKPTVPVAIIDAGFSGDFLDEDNEQAGLCATGSCENPFQCGGGADCPWHGTHVANAGFAEPNNQNGAAGPGAGASILTVQYGFGDMASLLYLIPKMVWTGERIVNISAAIPVPDWLFYTTLPAEVTLTFVRDTTGLLTFAAAGNAQTNVDAMQCFQFLLWDVCPWEKETWFPCESGGVDCVGGTNYTDKKRDTSYSNFGDSVGFWAVGTMLAGADPATTIGSQYHASRGTSYAAPFMAGTAALTWAADVTQSAGDVEDCLAAAQVGGENGRFVDTYLATACGLHNPANIAPLVEITNPSGEVATFDQVGLVSLTAEASDFESGTVSQIVWSSDVEGALGSTAPGAPLLFQPSGPGNRTITAMATDSQGLSGQDTVVLSFKPAPPVVRVISPKYGERVFAGLPTDLIAKVTNLAGLTPPQPCDTGLWTGYQRNTIIFNNLSGCSTQWSFLNPDQHHVDVSMTADGLTGKATHPFTVVDDGLLHVKITAPKKNTELIAEVPLATPITLSAASNIVNGVNTATYSWTVSLLGTVVTPIGVPLPGQTVNYTHADPGCGEDIKLRFSVLASDVLGRIATDSVDALIRNECPPI